MRLRNGWRERMTVNTYLDTARHDLETQPQKKSFGEIDSMQIFLTLY